MTGKLTAPIEGLAAEAAAKIEIIPAPERWELIAVIQRACVSAVNLALIEDRKQRSNSAVIGETTMATLTPGTICSLKSGSPLMTVKSVNGAHANVVWHSHGSFGHGQFPLCALSWKNMTEPMGINATEMSLEEASSILQNARVPRIRCKPDGTLYYIELDYGGVAIEEACRVIRSNSTAPNNVRINATGADGPAVELVKASLEALR
jgi:hypothetical protein